MLGEKMHLPRQCISPVPVGKAVHSGSVQNSMTGPESSALVQMSSRLMPIHNNVLEGGRSQELF